MQIQSASEKLNAVGKKEVELELRRLGQIKLWNQYIKYIKAKLRRIARTRTRTARTEKNAKLFIFSFICFQILLALANIIMQQ